MKKTKTLFARFLTLLVLALMSTNLAWGEDDVVATFESEKVVTSSAYATYSNDDWSLSKGGNNCSCGFNKTNKTQITDVYGTDATATHHGYTITSKNKLENVYKITFVFTAQNANGTPKLYLGYSTDGSTWNAVPLKSGDGLSEQGVSTSNANTTYTFEFTSTIPSAYYAIVHSASQQLTTSSHLFRFDNVTATFYKENASSKTLQSISVMTAPKTTYFVGDYFDPAGLAITATYDTGDPENVTYAGNESKFTFSPTLETALTTANDKVTITYGGKTVDQAITINLNKLETPTNLQATNVASTSATLTWDNVANASSYEVNVIGGDSYDETFTPATNSLLVEGLTASTEYLWSVKAIGNKTTYDDSDENGDGNFTTLAPPSVAYTVTFDGNEHGTPASASITEAEAGAGITLPGCEPNDEHFVFLGWADDQMATEPSAGVAGATYYPTTDNVTLYAVYKFVVTINYMVNGVNTNPQEKVYLGTPLVFPEVSAPDADHVFCGWVTTAIEGTQPTAPEYVNTTGLTATEDATYYAVFAEKKEGEVTWNKVTTLAGITEGQYVIINGGYYLPSTTTSSSPVATDGTKAPIISEGIITDENVTTAMKWNFTISESVVTIKNDNNDYLYTTSSNSGVRVGNTSATWTFEVKADNYFSMKCSTDRFCAVAPEYSDWRSYNSESATNYKGNGVKIELYKKTQGVTYSNYCTTFAVKELTSIELSGEYPTEFWKGDAFSHKGMTVTAHYSNADDADVTSKATFSGYDMNTASKQTVTVTYEGKTATYDITVKTIANTAATAYTVAEAIALIDANPTGLSTTEVYVKGTVSEIVTEFSSDYGNITFDVSTDGQTKGDQFRFYRNFKGANKTKWTSVDECPAVGDFVIGYGLLTYYQKDNVYELAEGNYIVNSANMAITSAQWGTFCAPFNVTIPEGVKAYTAAEGDNSVAFTEVTTTIPAGTPVVVYSAEEVDKNYFGALATGETCSEGALVGVYAATSDITAETGYTNYVLQKNAQGVGFYKVAEGSTISLKANRCYMTLPIASAAKACFSFDDIITGINEILNPTNKAVEGIFDLSGRKLAAPQKGVNIINGVKVIVK